MTTESHENANQAARIFDKIFEKLLQMPMASASDIAALHGLDSSYVHAGLRYLRHIGMAECAAMGFPGGPLLGFRSLPGGARPGRGNLSTARGPGPVPATDVSGGVALPGRGRPAGTGTRPVFPVGG